MKLIYTDPKKKTLQKIEIILMVLLLPPGLFFGAKSFAEWQRFKQAEATYHQAAELIHAGKYQEGALKLEETVARYPQYYAAWEELGVSYHMKGDHQKEVDAYERAIKALPESGNLHRELATAYHEIGEHEKELKVGELALDLDNSDPLFTQRVAERARKEASGELSTEQLPHPHAEAIETVQNPEDHSGHDHGDDHSGHNH